MGRWPPDRALPDSYGGNGRTSKGASNRKLSFACRSRIASSSLVPNGSGKSSIYEKIQPPGEFVIAVAALNAAIWQCRKVGKRLPSSACLAPYHNPNFFVGAVPQRGLFKPLSSPYVLPRLKFRRSDLVAGKVAFMHPDELVLHDLGESGSIFRHDSTARP